MIEREKGKKLKINSLRGMLDILPKEVYLWQYIEQNAKNLFELYNFQEIRTPILEKAELFLHSIGEETDIVEKEMYIFNDKKGRTIALRPEGTASVVRAYIEHSLFNHPTPQKYYYIGPMFRYERPQKGRFRQFHQIGVESFGLSSPKIDAELLILLKEFFQKLNIDKLSFEINSIGCKKCRPFYREELIKFLSEKVSYLCNDCRKRFEKNPLRVLDCKNQNCKDLLSNSPLVINFLCDDCNEHFYSFQRELDNSGINFKVNPKIVRGLDYYTKTVFEVTTNMLGSQNAVAAGGRYDDLVESFGGPPTPAAGFAIGVERIVELCRDGILISPKKSLVYVAYAGKVNEEEVRKVVQILREIGFITERPYESQSLKNQLKKADRLGADWVIIIGEEELKSSRYKWKKMKEGAEGEATLEEIIKIMRSER